MADFLERISRLPADRLALLAAELKSRLDRAESALEARREPIAVVGIGCRFPGGANSPDAYWAMLREGVDAVREIPAERWDVDGLYSPDPNEPGRMATRWGGFLDGLEEFDPWFFGISPREAIGMDPQQRLLLEVAWEALEHAGIAPDRLDGTSTGVFLGLCNQDYHALRLERPLEDIDSYFASGVSGSMAAGRIAYLLGLQGPAITVDTACSSSLVALHLACESLRNGESRMALAAGVSLILSPETMISLSQSRILSTDGKCRTFDADATGIARGEGCGVVVLKRLSDAQADGDRILATIRATGINQDGRSSGITAPNGAAQEALLRRTLASAGLKPADVAYVEAHGTGTSLGDPIEVRALAAVYGDRPKDQPLLVGSVKTNFGHLEAAAGVAGFIKAVLTLQSGMIPPHLHLRRKNPHIDWERMPIEVPTSLTELPKLADQPRRAAVSSFGFSGTNAHVILEEAPQHIIDSSTPDRSSHVLPLSARTPASLRVMAEQYATLLEQADAPALSDAAHTAATGRSLFAHRLAITASDSGEAAARLRAWLRGEEAEGVFSGKAASATACEPVFLFTGQGAQAVGMGRDLFDVEPVFRETLERCDALLRPHMSAPLLEVLYPRNDDDANAARLINRTEFAQPVLFALEYALAELWKSWGVEPVAVMGHSLGEYVAAAVAGLFSLEDALRIVAARGRLMQEAPEGGAMAAVFAPLADVEAVASAYPALDVAGVNGPENIVLSGDAGSLDQALAAFASRGVNARRLVVSHAFHSPLMEPILDRLEAIFDGVEFREPAIPIVSNLTGEIASARQLSSGRYWRDHTRRPVRFMEGIRALERAGHRTFLEIGPHPTLTGLAAACVESGDVCLVHSLRRGNSDVGELQRAAGALHVRGLRIDWENRDRPWSRRTVTLPTTPFERAHLWSGWTQKRPGAGQQTPADRQWTWQLEWQDAELPGIGIDPASVAKRIEGRANALVLEHGAGDYQHGLPMLDALSTALIVRALRELGWSITAGERVEPDTLREQLGIRPSHDRLLRRMLAILAEDGILAADDDGFVVLATPPDADVEKQAADLVASAPGIRAETMMTLRCGLQLPSVLRGADPLEVLFPGGSTDEMTALYSEAPSFKVFNTLVRDAVLDLVRVRSGRPVRILEVGGGTGSVTAGLLPHLPANGVHYLFTDVSPLFTSRASERFKSYTGFTALPYDVTRDAAAQGIEPGSYDIVIAANVLHATPDLKQTLSNLHSVMAPGGVLVALEGVRPQRFGDLTVGMTDGWWSFSDRELRPDYALLDVDRWMQVLSDAAFDRTVAFPDVPAADGGVLAQQRVILARKPVESITTASRWVALGDGAAATDVVTRLREQGLDITTLPVADLDTVRAAVAAQCERGGLDGVLHLAALDVEPGDATGTALVDLLQPVFETALGAVRALAENPGPRLALVTRASEAEAPGVGVDPVTAPLWGIGRNAAIEHPELRCLTIDLPDGPFDAAALAAALRLDNREDQVLLRVDGARVPRIRALDVAQTSAPLTFASDGAYLITGGLRGLGLRVASWMAEKGAGTLVLSGRREPDDAARQEIARLQAAGTTVHVVQGDVADAATVRAMLDVVGDTPVRGVIHSAGTTDDASMLSMDWSRVRNVMQAKVAGAWNLHVATRHLPLDHFVLFSSGAAFTGSPGQANHAAANSFLAALAHHRRALGQPALTIDWGPWSETGAATRGDVLERAKSAGLHPIDTAGGLRELERLMSSNVARAAVLPVDWARYLEQIPGGADRAWFDEVRPAAATTSVATTTPQESEAATALPEEAPLAARIRAATSGRRSEVIMDGVRAIAARVLGAGNGDAIDPAAPLTELGLDSLMAVEMRNRLAAALGMTLPSTLLFNYPSVEALTAYIGGSLDDADTDTAATATASEPLPAGVITAELDTLTEDEVANLLEEKLRHV